MDTPLTQPPPPPPKKNLNILIGVLLLLLGVFVGLMLDKTTLLSNIRIPYLGVTPTPLASPEPTAEAGDPTANWKTYNNSKYSFSLRYPSDWKETEESDTLLVSKLSDSYYFTPTNTDPHTGKSISVSVILKNPSVSYPNKDPKGYFDILYNRPAAEQNSSEDEAKLGNLIVDNLPAVKMKTQTPKEEVMHPTGNIDVYVFKDPYLYIVEAHQGSGRVVDQDLQDTFNQILSTFRFINNQLGQFCAGTNNLPCSAGYACKLNVVNKPELGGTCVHESETNP